jgi:hypothetical protein
LRWFVLQFSDAAHFQTGGDPVSVQLKLFEAGSIVEIHYQDAPAVVNSYSSGIEDSSGQIGTTYYFGATSMPANTAVSFFVCRLTDSDGDGFSECMGDCDDSDPARHPGRVEACDGIDSDCDTWDGNDADEDGVGTCGPDSTLGTADDDCDDSEANAFPGNPEVCDGIDNDCDASTDEQGDTDGDGASLCDGDCDVTNPTVYPMAPELCDGLDNDCMGQVDEGLDTDADNDGHYTPGSCAQPNDDCDDSDPAVLPGQTEVCNGIDDDCANGADFPGELMDADADGFLACDDCDDGNNAINSSAAEICDFIDNDCDASIDEGFDTDADNFTTYQGDCDDTNMFVNPGRPEACNGIDDDCANGVDFPGELVDADGDGALECEDCDDTDPTRHPGVPETCDAIDNDCDGNADEDFDLDLDGWTTCLGDCDDREPSAHPAHVEVPYDGIDNDCDGDELDDLDGDGFTGELAGGPDCDDLDPMVNPDMEETCDDTDTNCDGVRFPAEGVDMDEDGYTRCTDCDDFNPEVYPGGLERCNNKDDDCDGVRDNGFDADGDGFYACRRDCDDNLVDVNPEAVEQCDDGLDNDCDGEFDEEDCTGAIVSNCSTVSGRSPTPYLLLVWAMLALTTRSHRRTR